MDRLIIREANHTDAERICALLARLGLGAEGVLAPGTHYWLAEDAGDRVVGVVGLEYGAAAVLLRSAAVEPAARRRGVGVALVRQALRSATEAGFGSAYLFSTGAGPYWMKLGFCEAPVSELVAALPDARQVRHYHELGWLPTEVAWRRDLGAETLQM